LQCSQPQTNKKPGEQIKSKKTVFNPDGYYYPVDSLGSKVGQNYYKLQLGKYKLEYLEIALFEIAGSDYHPVKLTKSKSRVLLHFEDFNIKTNDYLVSHDTVIIMIKDRRIGKVKFEGKFLTSKGPLDDESVEVTKTIVMKCKVTENQKPPFNVSFVFWEGD
jgi:hypothetical protein